MRYPNYYPINDNRTKHGLRKPKYPIWSFNKKKFIEVNFNKLFDKPFNIQLAVIFSNNYL